MFTFIKKLVSRQAKTSYGIAFCSASFSAVRNFLPFCGTHWLPITNKKTPGAYPLVADNSTASKYSNNSTWLKRWSLSMDMRYHRVRDGVQRCIFTITRRPVSANFTSYHTESYFYTLSSTYFIDRVTITGWSLIGIDKYSVNMLFFARKSVACPKSRYFGQSVLNT